MTNQNRRRQMAVGWVPNPTGRPIVSPFISPEVEQDFCRRARLAVQHYFDPSPLNTKKKWQLPAGVTMGKATYWAYLTVLYLRHSYPEKSRAVYPDVSEPLLTEINWTRLLDIITRAVGSEYVGDRSVITRRYSTLQTMYLGNHLDTSDQSHAGQVNIDKQRREYAAVVASWAAL